MRIAGGWRVGAALVMGVLLGISLAAWRTGVYVAAAGGLGQDRGVQTGGSGDTGTVTPVPVKPGFQGEIGRTIGESRAAWPQPVRAPKGAPNVLYIVIDDVGFGQLSCYGGGVKTPNLDKLAQNGLRYANFHTTALCSPSRSCFLTGRNHHSNAMACITEGATGFPGSNGHIPLANGFLSEMLTPFGWIAFAIGKWHLTPMEEMNLGAPRTQWPLGRGFERFYGFLGAETNNWYPDLTQDSQFVKPPKTPEQGYHLTVDLTDKAIEYLTDLRNVDPEKPFFMYFCTGAAHAPHHSPKEWADKYKGQFDSGWDVYREETFKRQLAMGIISPGTKLPARDPDVPEWAKVGADEKKLYARMMEVFAGFLSHADDNIGRLIAYLEQSGQLDNTLVFVVSDNGASPEGGVHGSINENLFMNLVPDDLKTNLKYLDVLGGVQTYNHYAWGWTWAGNTPFRRWKREVHRGGCTDPLIVHWPKGIKAKGDIRHQFVHAIDLVPTALDAVGIHQPAVIKGVSQSPIEGASFRHTFDDPKAKSKRNTQYFEMFASRAIYHDGWRAVAPWPFGQMITEADLDKVPWELYHVDKDAAEAENLAKTNMAKLQQLKDLWWTEAGKYNVLPLDGRGQTRLLDPRPQITSPRKDFVYLPRGDEVPNHVAVNPLNRSFSVRAEATVPKEGAEGVVLAHGGRFAGYALFVKNKKLHFSYNFCGLEETKAVSNADIPSGKVTLRMDFKKKPKDPKLPPVEQLGAGGTATISINGKAVGSVEIARTIPMQISLAGDGLCVGFDGGTPVSADYTGYFPFTGTIQHVVVSIGDDGPTTEVPRKDKTRD
jgi:arylsulfatase A-like enzyme